MRPPEVADGVFELGTKWANFYLLVDQSEATLIDAGYPRYWQQVTHAPSRFGTSPGRRSTFTRMTRRS